MHHNTGRVGKTSIIQNYIRKTISSAYKPTIGADFFSKKLEIVSGDDTLSVTLQVWDTAGQERFRTLTLSFYKQAQGVIVTFDVTNQASFKSVKLWLESIYEHAEDNVAKILVGNKVDMVNERKISEEDAKKMAA